MNLDKLALVENSLFEFSLKLSLCLKGSVIDYLPSIYLKTFSLTKICHGAFDLALKVVFLLRCGLQMYSLECSFIICLQSV